MLKITEAERVYFLVGPVVAWSCLCLVKLCGTHLTSAFGVSGIHCYNYAIMGLYSLTVHPHPHLTEMPQLYIFFPSTLLVSSFVCLVCAGLLYLVSLLLFLFFWVWVWMVFGSQQQSTTALCVASSRFSLFDCVYVFDVCLII